MTEPSKDQRSRGRGKICKDVAGELVSMILGDNSYQTAWLLVERTKIARKAMDKLNGPPSVLKRLKLLMKPITMKNTISGVDAKNALQVLESVLEQLKHTVLYQDQANEIDEQKLLQLEGQETNVESHFQGDTIPNQGWTNKSYEHLPGLFPLKGQETNVESHFPWYTVLNQGWTNETYDHLPGSFPFKGQETNVESYFPGDTVLNQGRTNVTYKHLPGSFPFKGQETNVESYFPGDLKQAISEVASTSKGPLEMSKYEGGSLDILNNLNNVDNLNNLNNVNNVSNSMIREWLDWSEVTRVKDYTVFEPNAIVLTEILQKHPNIDEKFQVKHPEFQSFIMKSLAEVYQKIESKPEMLELKEISSMEAKIQDMELTGLQLSWLKETLAKVTEMLKHKAEKKRLQEEIDSFEAKAKEAREKLAKLEKKPRFE